METRLEKLKPFWEECYTKLQEFFVKAEKYDFCIDSIKMKMFNVYPQMLHEAEGEEEKAFVRACEQKIVACYQRALDQNYKEIETCKGNVTHDHRPMRTWTLTLDGNGTPKKTSVVAIDQKGGPVYADGCTAVDIAYELQTVWNCQHTLRKWLDTANNDLYELREAARALKPKGCLGKASIPSPNYNLSGLVGGQLDAAAWQNYAIETGTYCPTDYDQSLDTLLKNIDLCIDFYEKAILMLS